MTTPHERLRFAREQAGLSIGQVAKMWADEPGNVRSAETCRETLKRLETGASRPTENLLAYLADIYQVSVNWLLTGESEHPEVRAQFLELAKGKLRLEDVERLCVALESMAGAREA